MTFKKLQNISLQTHLTITVGLIFIFAYFSSFLINHQIYHHYLEKQYETHLVAIAGKLVSWNTLHNFEQKQPDVDNFWRIFQEEKEVKYIGIFDQSREYSFYKSRQNLQDEQSIETIFNHLDLSQFNYPAVKKFNDGRVVIYPLKSDGQSTPAGYLLIGFDDSINNLVTRKALYKSLIFSSVFAFLGLFFIQRFSRRTIAPIRNLMTGTEQVINGNFEFQIKVKDESELSELARKFNEMTLKLNYYDKQKSLLNRKLNKVNEELEEKVKERTAQLKKIQQEVLSIFHQIPVGLLVIDEESRIMWYNHELMKIIELPIEYSLSRQKTHEVIQFNKIGLSEVLSSMSRKAGKHIIQHHLSFARSRSPKLVEVASQSLMREKDEVDGTIFIIKDVTREVSLEKKMFQDQRLENIGKIAGGIAHDFNNILAIILPNAQLLKLQLKDNPDWVKYLDTIERAADQAAALTKKILSFSRGSSYDNFEILKVNDVIGEFTRMFRRVLDRKIEIVEHLDKKLWNIKAEKSQLEQVLMNLSVNSRDAMPEGGDLIFETQNVVLSQQDKPAYDLKMKAGKYVCICVSDTGSGIDANQLDKIFDPFFSNKKEGKGTGLGLSVVYGIIKTHQGVIDVKSKINEGTQFCIYIPACEEKIEKTEKTVEKLVAGSGTLLIVDDEEMIQETLRGMLESLNYKVIFASDGKSAIRKYKSHRKEIDAILMDIQMPVMDGVEAAQKILKLNPRARIVFTSGYAEAKNFEKLRKMGYQLFLKKPYKITNLADIIVRALSQESSKN
jgi:two-component system cell cycle sensor histidine kinase/response regulator CckA